MKVFKIRSIEEAKAIELPQFPQELLDEARQFFLETKRTNLSRYSILKKIYGLVDRGADVVKPFAVCNKGCSACCEIPVEITELEASYIERNTGRRMAIRSGYAPSRNVKTACPFLSDDNACSIYEFRPFACRVYHVFDDPELCADLETIHVTYGPKSNSLFENTQQWIFHLNARGAFYDIRAFFGEGRQKKICS